MDDRGWGQRSRDCFLFGPHCSWVNSAESSSNTNYTPNPDTNGTWDQALLQWIDQNGYSATAWDMHINSCPVFSKMIGSLRLPIMESRLKIGSLPPSLPVFIRRPILSAPRPAAIRETPAPPRTPRRRPLPPLPPPRPTRTSILFSPIPGRIRKTRGRYFPFTTPLPRRRIRSI